MVQHAPRGEATMHIEQLTISGPGKQVLRGRFAPHHGEPTEPFTLTIGIVRIADCPSNKISDLQALLIPGHTAIDPIYADAVARALRIRILEDCQYILMCENTIEGHLPHLRKGDQGVPLIGAIYLEPGGAWPAPHYLVYKRVTVELAFRKR